MADDKFIYTTYIRTTPEKLWAALTEPEFMRQYWFGCWTESEWRAGSSWQLKASDGDVMDGGEVLEIDPGKRLVLSWRNEFMPELKAEGFSRATFEIEPGDTSVKLTVTHEIAVTGSKFIPAVSGGWPKILSSLKSLLETGDALPRYQEASKAA